MKKMLNLQIDIIMEAQLVQAQLTSYKNKLGGRQHHGPDKIYNGPVNERPPELLNEEESRRTLITNSFYQFTNREGKDGAEDEVMDIDWRLTGKEMAGIVTTWQQQ